MYAHQESHPWITFELPDLTVRWRIWLRLGEADSKCQHLTGVPVKPSIAAELMAFYLAKGARSTTAIEGNTLTEEQVRAIANNTATIPASREYQEVEVRNVIGLMTEISRAVVDGELRFPLTVIKAIVAHVYLSWIQPFDDGNGHTTRLVEHQILAMSQAGSPAGNLPAVRPLQPDAGQVLPTSGGGQPQATDR